MERPHEGGMNVVEEEVDALKAEHREK